MYKNINSMDEKSIKLILKKVRKGAREKLGLPLCVTRTLRLWHVEETIRHSYGENIEGHVKYMLKSFTQEDPHDYPFRAI